MGWTSCFLEIVETSCAKQGVVSKLDWPPVVASCTGPKT